MMFFFRSNKLTVHLAQFLKSRRNDTKMTKIKIAISNNVYTKKVLKNTQFL